jgi:hypothetical protein
MDQQAMKKWMLTLGLILAFASYGRSQDEEKIKELFQGAIEAMGGDDFLNVKDMVSEGQFFMFNREGENSSLIKFSDYTKLPDKSRHESGNRKGDLEITVFNLGKNEGWIVEGQKPVREAKPDEMTSFRNVVKHSLDIIFRDRFKDPTIKLFYLGTGEGLEVTNDIVKLVDPENDETLVYFDRISKLPAKIEYHEINRRGIRMHLVDEFSQWHVYQGVNTPLRIDSYVNGRRASQTFVLKITYNNDLPDSFFSKPVPEK